MTGEEVYILLMFGRVETTLIRHILSLYLYKPSSNKFILRTHSRIYGI